MPDQRIDTDLCTRCGACAAICPTFSYERTAESIAINEAYAGMCIKCGQCMAACPTRAVSVQGLDSARFVDFTGGEASPEALLALMLKRRSIRAFKDDPVPRELLERIVGAATTAPMGFPPSGVEVTVLTTRAQVAEITPVAVKQVEDLSKLMGSALGRFILRRMAKKQWLLIRDYLLPLMAPGVELYRRDGVDVINWGAPAMLIFHTGHPASGETDCTIAATYAMLMAESLGLGNIMLGMSAAALQFSKPLKARFEIPPDNTVYNVLALGHAKHAFQRSIPREFKRVKWPGG